MIINGEKFACDTCIRGHRVAQCKHTDRPLRQISSKGRPVSQCDHCRDLRKSSSVHTRCKCASEALNPASGVARCRCFIGEGCTCAHSKKQPASKGANETDSVGIGSPASESTAGTPRLSATDQNATTPQTVPAKAHRPLAMKPMIPTRDDSKKSCCSSNTNTSCCSSNAKPSCCGSETAVPDTTGSCCSPTEKPQDVHLPLGNDFLVNDAQADLYGLTPSWPMPTNIESALDPQMLALFDDTHLNVDPQHSLDIFGPLSSNIEQEVLGQGLDLHNVPIDWNTFEFQPTLISDIPHEENRQDQTHTDLP